jgi:hypothetical protein
MLLALFDLDTLPDHAQERQRLIASISPRLRGPVETVRMPSGFAWYSKQGLSKTNPPDFQHCTSRQNDRGCLLDGYLINPTWAEYSRIVMDDCHKPLNGSDLTAFNGSYNIINWQTASKSLLIANDCLGFRCLYYWISDDECRIIVASTLALLRVALPQLRPNVRALGQQLLLSGSTNGASLLTGVSRLEPGSAISFSADGLTIHTRLTELPWGIEHYHLSLEEAAGLIVEVGIDAIKTWVEAKDVTVSLSGGYDSRFLILLARRFAGNIDAVNLGTPEWIDTTLAQQFCRAARIPLRICAPPRVTTLEKYISITKTVQHPSDYLSPFWLDNFSKTFDSDRLVLNGFFGGPLTGSTIGWVEDIRDDWSGIVRDWCRAVNQCNVPLKALKETCVFDVQELHRQTIAELTADEPSNTLEGFQKLFYLEWIIRQCGFVAPDTYSIFRTFSTVIVPFVDHRLLQLFTNLRRELLYQQEAYVHAIRTIDYTGVPFASTSVRLLHPSTYYKGPQSHIERNFTTVMADCSSYILDNRVLLSAFFNTDRIASLFSERSLQTDLDFTIPQRLMLLNAAILLVELSS